MSMKLVKGLVKSYEIKSFNIDNKAFVIKGWASKAIPDRVNDLVLPTAFIKSIERFEKNSDLMPPVLLGHDPLKPIGQTKVLEIKTDGLWVEAEIASGYEEADKARKMIESGAIRFFSVGIIPRKSDYENDLRIIKEADLVEISITPVPVCQDAVFSMNAEGKNIKIELIEDSDIEMETKAVSGKTTWDVYPDRYRAWSKRDADKRIRKWASTDGSGDIDKIDWNKYKSVHFWYDEKNPENITSYKLLFCDVINGKVYAIPRAIFAVAVVLQGGRGGVDIPESDKEKIKKKVEVYYHKMDMLAPWERDEKGFTADEVLAFADYQNESLKALIEDFKSDVSKSIEKIIGILLEDKISLLQQKLS